MKKNLVHLVTITQFSADPGYPRVLFWVPNTSLALIVPKVHEPAQTTTLDVTANF